MSTEDNVFGEMQRPSGVYSRVPGLSHVPKSKSLDPVLESTEVAECRNSYSTWIQSKHNGVASRLSRQTKVKSEGGLLPQTSGDNDWLIQLSPPAGERRVTSGKSVPDGERRKSVNPFENIDAAALEELKAEVGQSRDNPFADVLVPPGEGKIQVQIGGDMKESVKGSISECCFHSPLVCF